MRGSMSRLLQWETTLSSVNPFLTVGLSSNEWLLPALAPVE